MCIVRYILCYVVCLSYCLSIYLSITLMYCVETTELITLDCSLGTLVYRYETQNLNAPMRDLEGSLNVPSLGTFNRRGVLKSYDVTQICSYVL